jgi:hypothetical protein
MFIIIEVIFILLIAGIYLYREKSRKIKEYRSGDVIWVREKLIKSRKAVLCNWDENTFSYIPDESDELLVKHWFFLIRNETYHQRRNNPHAA